MSTPRYFQHVLVEPALFTTADAYAVVPYSELDTLRHGSKWIAFQFVESNNKGATVKLQGSIDGTTWVDLRAQDVTGAAFSSTEIAVTGNATVQAFLNDDSVTNSPNVYGGFRFYRVSAKSTVGSNPAKLTIVGLCK
jgi:hypothetical protein